MAKKSKKNFLMVMSFQENSKVEALETARMVVESAHEITRGDIISASVGHPNPSDKLPYEVFHDGDLGVKVKNLK